MNQCLNGKHILKLNIVVIKFDKLLIFLQLFLYCIKTVTNNKLEKLYFGPQKVEVPLVC